MSKRREITDLLAKHALWESDSGAQVECYANDWEADMPAIVWDPERARDEHAAHQVAVLAAARLLPDTDEE